MEESELHTAAAACIEPEFSTQDVLQASHRLLPHS